MMNHHQPLLFFGDKNELEYININYAIYHFFKVNSVYVIIITLTMYLNMFKSYKCIVFKKKKL